MVSLKKGLSNSLVVLEHLRNVVEDEGLGEIYITVGTFVNGRECGLTFAIYGGVESFTYCVYEHRNSDAIIINGREGYASQNGDLPYAKDSKYGYLAEFGYNKHYDCAVKLADLIKKKYKELTKTKEQK